MQTPTLDPIESPGRTGMAPVVAAYARSLARAGRLREAAATLDPILRDDSDPAILDLAARVHSQLGNFARSSELWTAALERDPGNPAYLDGLKASRRSRRIAPQVLRGSLGIAAGATLCACLLFLFTPGNRSTGVKTGGASRPAPTPTRENPPPDPEYVAARRIAKLSDSSAVHLIVGWSADGKLAVSGQAPTVAALARIKQAIQDAAGGQTIDTSDLKLQDSYAVRPGDSLWGIAHRVFGDGDGWPSLAKANGLQAPFVLAVGQRLWLNRP